MIIKSHTSNKKIAPDPSAAAVKFLKDIIQEPFTLGGLLRSIRLCEEETLEAFAHQLSISRSHLLDIEKGRKGVSPSRAVKFAETLGYPPQQFVALALQDLLQREGFPGKVTIEIA